MSLFESKHLFRKGQLDEALKEIETEISLESKILKCHILLQKSHINEALIFLDEILIESAKNENQIIKIQASLTNAYYLFSQSRWTEAFDAVHNSEKLLQGVTQSILSENKFWIAELKAYQGMKTMMLIGEMNSVDKFLQEAIELYIEDNHYWGITKALNWQSDFHSIFGDFKKSKELAEESYKISSNWGIEPQKAYSLRKMSGYYSHVGDIDKAIKCLQEGITIAKNVQDYREEAYSRMYLGLVYLRQGEFIHSNTQLQQSLLLSEELGDQHLSAKNILNIGDILQKKGDVYLALEKFQEAFPIFRTLKDVNCSHDTNLKLGRAYMALGKLDDAHEQFRNSYIHRRWNWKDNQPTNKIPLDLHAYIETVFQLILVNLELNSIIQATEYHQKLEDLNAEQPNTIIKYHLKLTKALILKKSKRIKNKIQAQIILEQLVSVQISDYGLTVLTMLNYCDMLVTELKIYGEEEVLHEIETLVKKLLLISKEQNTVPLQLEILILQSKIDLINGKALNASDTLDQAVQITEKYEFPHLTIKIQEQQTKLYAELGHWKELVDKNATLQDRLEYAQMNVYIEKVQKFVKSYSMNEGTNPST